MTYSVLFLSPPESSDNEPLTEDIIPEMDSEVSVTPDSDGGVEEVTFSEDSWPDNVEGGIGVEFVDAPPRAWTSETSQSSPELSVICSEVGFYITLPAGPLSDMKVLGMYLAFTAELLPSLYSVECMLLYWILLVTFRQSGPGVHHGHSRVLWL